MARRKRAGKKTPKKGKQNAYLPFDDGGHIIYVNGEDQNASTELGRLMHDFYCTDPGKMHYKVLADLVRYFKEDERGVKQLCKAMEDMREEISQYVAKKVEAETTKRVEAETTKRVSWTTKAASVLRWHKMGLSPDAIAQGEELTMEQVQGILGLQQM